MSHYASLIGRHEKQERWDRLAPFFFFILMVRANVALTESANIKSFNHVRVRSTHAIAQFPSSFDIVIVRTSS